MVYQALLKPLINLNNNLAVKITLDQLWNSICFHNYNNSNDYGNLTQHNVT